MKISRTPLRFSLIGGGSDLPAYWRNYGPSEIISMTLEASMYVTFNDRLLYDGVGRLRHTNSIKETYGHNIRLSYMQTETVDTIDELEHDLVRETLQFLEDVSAAFEMTTIGDIPSRGAGLGSSSALIVGILRILNPGVSKSTLAHMAAAIEISQMGKHIGVQDHFSAAFGEMRYYKFWNDSGCDKYEVTRLDVGHALAKRLIAFRLPVNRSENAQSVAPHDRLVDMEREMEGRAGFLKETVGLVQPMGEALRDEEWCQVGRIMKVAWELKLASHGGIDKDTERWYSIGMDNGALAGKVSGSMSKGAGHLFFLAFPDNHHRIRDALVSELAEMDVEYYPYGSKMWEI